MNRKEKESIIYDLMQVFNVDSPRPTVMKTLSDGKVVDLEIDDWLKFHDPQEWNSFAAHDNFIALGLETCLQLVIKETEMRSSTTPLLWNGGHLTTNRPLDRGFCSRLGKHKLPLATAIWLLTRSVREYAERRKDQRVLPLCGYMVCVAPDHLAIMSEPDFRDRKNCDGVKCEHIPPCIRGDAPEDRDAPPPPQAQKNKAEVTTDTLLLSSLGQTAKTLKTVQVAAKACIKLRKEAQELQPKP
jgi:hypothetical protein